MKVVITAESRPTCTLGQCAWTYDIRRAHNYEDKVQVTIEPIHLFHIPFLPDPGVNKTVCQQ